jgi:fatty acid desaturase
MTFQREKDLEARFRSSKWIIPFATLMAAALLYSGLTACMLLFNEGYYWSIFPAGLLAHSFMIVVVHDGAHRAITRSKADSFIMNIGAGMILLPFYGEPFRRFHLIHHANTNKPIDPLWPETKRKLFKSSRLMYFLSESIPLLFTLFLLFMGQKKQKTAHVKGPKIRWTFMLFATTISVVIIALVLPSVWFILGTLLVLNLFGNLRHWCEHMGTVKNIESNTYHFPLGMGIGNHDTHHHHPNYSWLTLMVGLYTRKKDTDPLRAAWGVLFSKKFHHYEEVR